MQPSGLPLVFTAVFNRTSLDPDLEQQLVEACIRGDRSAQLSLYNRYSKAMYNTCLRMLRSEADAEDALQTAFVEVFGKLDSFRFESTLGAWIKRIVVNTCINHLKKRRLVTIDWDEQIPEPQVASEEYDDDHNLEVDRIRKAILELPDGYRTVFSLYLLEGYDHAEIGQILNISETTSKSQYSRARQKLRQILLKD